MASWSGTSSVSSDAHFVIDSQSLSEVTGTRSLLDLHLEHRGRSGGGGRRPPGGPVRRHDFAARSDLDSGAVDVVPYITGMARTVGTNRSKHGRSPCRRARPASCCRGTTWQGHPAGSGSAPPRPGGSVYDDVAITASGSPYTNMTVSLAAVTHSDVGRAWPSTAWRRSTTKTQTSSPTGRMDERPRLHLVERRPLPEGWPGRSWSGAPATVHVHHG